MSEAITAPVGSKEEKRAFNKMLFRIVLPIVVQYLLNNAISSVDVIMLNFVGQNALASVSLATQFSFVLNMIFSGLASGAAVLTAQYWGKKDYRTIEKIMGIAFRMALLFSTAFALGAILFPRQLMMVFTGEAALIQDGALYLRVVGISFLFMGISTMYLNMMRSMERVVLSTATSAIAFGVNVVLNSAFIFGWFGIPKMGILGVALATVAARFVQLMICMVDASRSKTVKLRVKYILQSNPLLMKDFFKFALPALGNDLVWGVGISMYSVIIGHMSSDAVAANSIIKVVHNLACVAGLGLSNGTGIIIGKTIGSGDTDRAKKYASRLLRMTWVASSICALVMIALHPAIMAFGGELTETARGYLSIMIWINAYYAVAKCVNSFTLCGVIRAGGDAKFGFILETIALWCVFIPLGAFCGYVLKLPVMVVYTILWLDEAAKYPVILRRYLKGEWARNITRDWEE